MDDKNNAEIYDALKERMALINTTDVDQKRILDVGAGRGKMSILLAKNFNCSITCIDPNEQKLERAKANAIKENVADKITFKVEDARKTTFPDKYFDVVFCFSVLHHVEKEDREKVVRELFRIGKEVLIGELHKKGAEIFDTIVHPNENHSKIRVDLQWLESLIKELSKKVEKTERPLFYFYRCFPK
ncbi:MAG: class I SAM-dependent methyltransferase [Promethearchaeota archaeon]